MSKRKKGTTCDCGRVYEPDPKHPELRCKWCIKNVKSADVKEKAIQYLGGKKCVICGYEGPAVAFDFDHKDPKKKSYKISGHWLVRWKILKKELDKCQISCSNCHRIRHLKEVENVDLRNKKR